MKIKMNLRIKKEHLVVLQEWNIIDGYNIGTYTKTPVYSKKVSKKWRIEKQFIFLIIPFAWDTFSVGTGQSFTF